MLSDLRTEPDVLSRPFDICIVGAGAAGIALCRQLKGKGHSLCLLESGGLDFEKATQQLYRGTNVGAEYYELEQSRLRFFGGTVAIWGGRCALLDPIDFERREWVPHSGWPFDRSELLPWYGRAHDMLDLGPFDYGGEEWQALRPGSPDFDTARIDAAIWRFDEMVERFTADRARDVIDAPDVHVVHHANVVHVQASTEANRIEHVVVRPLDGPKQKVRARHFIVATGGIENSRILLASRDIEPRGIGNARDQVGRYWMEHPNGRLGRVVTDDPFRLWSAYQKRFRKNGVPIAPVIRLGDETQRREQALNSAATLKLQSNPRSGVALGNRVYQDLKHSIDPGKTGRRLNHAYRGLRAWIHRNLRNRVESTRVSLGIRSLYLMIRGEQAPNPDSRILLGKERDPLGMPLARLDWRLSEIDKHGARVLARTFGSELERLGMGRIEPMPWLSEPGTAWPADPTVGNHPIGGYHHMGGTRMSASPSEGVVDADCRVHGYDNLYVAGSSVFPTGGWANPTLTILALSMRLGEHLSERLASERR